MDGLAGRAERSRVFVRSMPRWTMQVKDIILATSMHGIYDPPLVSPRVPLATYSSHLNPAARGSRDPAASHARRHCRRGNRHARRGDAQRVAAGAEPRSPRPREERRGFAVRETAPRARPHGGGRTAAPNGPFGAARDRAGAHRDRGWRDRAWRAAETEHRV